MLLEHRGHHRAHRDDAFAVRPRRVERLFDEDGRQAALTEGGIELGGGAHTLVPAVVEVGSPDVLALHRDCVPAVLGGDGGLCACLVGCHRYSFLIYGLGRNRMAGSGGAESLLTEPAYPATAPKRSSVSFHSRRWRTMSSWLRPTKFHHITNCSPNGVPPNSNTRAGLSPTLRNRSVARP